LTDATIVNVALPTIGRDFKVSATAVDAISIAFLVSLAVFIPASGWLGDRFGGKRVLLAAIVVFTAASALCGRARCPSATRTPPPPSPPGAANPIMSRRPNPSAAA
jgi:MFS family permease